MIVLKWLALLLCAAMKGAHDATTHINPFRKFHG